MRLAKSSARTGIESILFTLSAVILGGVLGALEVFPFNVVKNGISATPVLWHELTQDRPDILQPARYDGNGVVAIDRQAVQPGHTLIQGILPGGTQIRMIDIDGAEVHRWKVDFFDIWPDPKHVIPASRLPKSQFNYHTQGFWPLRDGSVVVNVGDLGTAKLDRCGKAVWTVDRLTHHSVTPTQDGKFWIPAHIPLAETPRKFLPTNYSARQIERMLHGMGRHYNNSILRIDSYGRVEREFSVLKAVYDAGLEHAIYASQQEVLADPTHVNDIEVVTAELAEKLENVNSGDLLVSLREMHMLAILDQNDGRLKWYKQGPWFRQHDPDIMPDGTIEIFNNRSNSVGSLISGSQIVSYEPDLDKTRVLFPKSDNDVFLSEIMGAHQKLENGNILITETMAGRVFEETMEGQIVWDYRLPYDNEFSSVFELAMRVPPDYFDVTNWACEE